jgi:hypothetical protein
MNGAITALVGFIFVCVIYPHLIKNKPQFYAALGLTCIDILLDGLGSVGGYGFHGFLYFLCSVLTVGALLLFFLAAGGLTWKELAGDMSHAFEVIRRGETTKEVIVPLTGEMPKPRTERTPTPRPPTEGTSSERIPLDE